MSCGILVKSGAASQADGLKFALDLLARESKPTSALQQALALLTSLSLPAGLTAEMEALLPQSSKHRLLARGLLCRGRQLMQAANLALQADLCLICCWRLCFDADLLQAGGSGSSRG